MPIFACTEEFMGEWLMTNPHDKAFDTWMTGVDGYEDDTGAWKANTCVEGQVWYRYTCLNNDPVLTSVSDNSSQDEPLTIYPNPVSGILNIEFNAAKLDTSSIELLDQMGRSVPIATRKYSTGKLNVDVSAMAAGFYWIRIGSAVAPFVVQ